MNNIELYVPKLEDLWFREECMSDPDTMNYNAGYDVHFEGYHYDTGCIDFPKDKWKGWYEEKMKNPNFFYAYILAKDFDKFVGYCNFNYKPEKKQATMGIVIKKEFQGNGLMRPAMELLIKQAKKQGVVALTDTVPENRENALKVFYSLGFEKIGEFKSKKFNSEEIVAEIEKKL